MKLIELRLENLQGIRSWSMAPKGQDVDILGDNGTGKTTVANAMLWLLTGKPVTGAAGYSPKTFGADGHEIHNLDHSVEASFELDDHTMVTFRRTLSEIWKKKRGSQKAELTGNATAYFIDDVPAKETDFNARVEQICPAEYIPLLMLPRAFAASLPWKKRRELLLDVCGDVSDDDVIRGTPGLTKALPPYLAILGAPDQHYTVDQYREKAAARLRKINASLQALPARIDEAQRAMPELTETEKELLAEDTAALSAQKDRLMTQIEQARQGGDSTAKKQLAADIAGAEKALSDAKAAFYAGNGRKTDELRRQINRLNEEQLKQYDKINAANRSAKELEERAKRIEKQRDDLMDQYGKVAADVASINAEKYTGANVCPTCGQLLPDDQIKAAREKWKDAKAERLKALYAQLAGINRRGKETCSTALLKSIQEQAEQKKAEAEKAAEAQSEISGQIKKATEAVLQQPTFESTPQYKQLKAAVDTARARAEADNSSAEVDKAVDALHAQLVQLGSKLEDISAAQRKRDMRAQQERRVAELSEEQRKLGAEYENVQHGIYLCELFMRSKVSMLDERINGRFETVRFRLFEQQINGGLKDCCDVLIPCETGLVPYADANNAAQVNAGIEIIRVLSHHIGASLPIIVDNAESVNRLLETNAQVIRTVVSHDKKLRAVARPAELEKESA